MSAPRYARLASKVFARERASIPPPPPAPERRAQAIAALELEIAARAHKRRVSRWGAALIAVAAGFAATVGVSRYVGHRSAPIAIVPPPPAQAVQIVARSIGGGSMGAPGTAEARTLATGSRVVTPPNERATLAFSTGTSVQIGGGADMTVVGEGASQVLRLDAGSIDLHVAKLAAGQRFMVDTSDAEIEVRGTQFRVWIAPREPACGAGTATRVSVTEGVVVVRHAGEEEPVAAGEHWPTGCAMTSDVVTPPALAPPAARPPVASTLAEQNRLFAEAASAKRRGDAHAALAAFDRFLMTYPSSPLAESASVERMRLLRATGSARAVPVAVDYLARYSKGFARSEAEAIVAGNP